MIKKFISKFRLSVLFAVIIITPIGFASKFYNGFAAKWFNNSFGGLLYVIFWCLVFALIFIRAKPWKIALSVFMITSILEFLQLMDTPFLEVIRSTFIGRTLIGTTFVPSDFFYYFLGSVLGFLILTKLKKTTNS